MSPHGYSYRPTRFRLHRPWWKRVGVPLLRVGLAAGLVTCLVLGTAALIARIHATDAALESAHAQGMAVGHTMCRSR